MNKAFGIAGLVILAIFGLVIFLYGNARFAEGKSSCTAGQAVAKVEQNDTARKNLENAQKKAKEIKTDDLDNALRGLSIMRDNEDR